MQTPIAEVKMLDSSTIATTTQVDTVLLDLRSLADTWMSDVGLSKASATSSKPETWIYFSERGSLNMFFFSDDGLRNVAVCNSEAILQADDRYSFRVNVLERNDDSQTCGDARSFEKARHGSQPSVNIEPTHPNSNIGLFVHISEDCGLTCVFSETESFTGGLLSLVLTGQSERRSLKSWRKAASRYSGVTTNTTCLSTNQSRVTTCLSATSLDCNPQLYFEVQSSAKTWKIGRPTHS